MFAREQKNEYDPTAVPVVERPLAANRPLSQVGGNAFGGNGIEGQRQEPTSNHNFKAHRRGESQNKIPHLNRTHSDTPDTSIFDEKSPSPSPSRNAASPTKSSLSNRFSQPNTFPRNFDPNNSIWSDDDDTETKILPSRPLRRQAKSVTFDSKPPEINEYEMVTPDPSVASVASGSREGSYEDFDSDLYDMDLGGGPNEDDSFDASLEDTEKTPVVLPEDWRHMSPEVASNTLANTFDDPFGKKEDKRTPSEQWHDYRTASINSDGDSRPLPPVPPFSQDERPGSSGSIVDRVRAAHERTLPTIPRVSSESPDKESMTLEDRLRQMGLQDLGVQDSTLSQDSGAKEAARLRKHGLGIHVREEEVASEDFGFPNEFKAPRISRESILRKVQSRTFEHGTTQGSLDTFEEEHSYGDLDPDVPIPSREASSNFDEHVGDESPVHIKMEEEDEQVDLYSIPAMYAASYNEDEEEDYREGSVIRHDMSGGDIADDESVYSQDKATEEGAQRGSNSATDEDEGPPTPKQEFALRTSTPRISGGSNGSDHRDLPELSLLDDVDFQSGFASFLGGSSTPPPPPEKDDVPIPSAQKSLPKLDMQSVSEYMRREVSPPAEYEEPGSPSSVVHRPISPEEASLEEASPVVESPTVPEPVATIKAPGGRLKTRVSQTPADLNMMAAQRRQVSGQEAPPIPEKSPKRHSMSLEPEHGLEKIPSLELPEAPINRRQSFRGIDIGDESFGEDISFGLDKEFDRVIEGSKVHTDLFHPHPHATVPASQQPSPTGRLHEEKHFSYVTELSTPANLTPRTKKGYLMRQNTKVVVAKRNFSNESGMGPMSPTLEPRLSNAGTRSAGSSPRKPSHERSKSWTTEPWNGKARRKSIRSLSATKRAREAPAPPMPGQESALTAGLDTVMEDQAMSSDGDGEDGVERGRLFVKVVGVKDLDLPLPQSKLLCRGTSDRPTNMIIDERTYFQLTLDNGLHCVTTSWLELGRAAPIGQEFELVVLNDLEFQLTLQTKLTAPAKTSTPPRPTSPTKSTSRSPIKKSSFSHLLMSPKKRREHERIAKEKAEQEEADRIAAERQIEQNARSARSRTNPNATAWDLLHELVAADGSFGRAYVCLKNHEDQCFGRPITVDMPIFNEWALEDAAIANSVKSKRGGVVRRPPYQVGKLTLQLLYVPRPKGSAEEAMPKSMNACIREMKDAEEADKREFEGFLSQQGGDCPVSTFLAATTA